MNIIYNLLIRAIIKTKYNKYISYTPTKRSINNYYCNLKIPNQILKYLF